MSFWGRKSKTKFMNYNNFIKKHVVKHKKRHFVAADFMTLPCSKAITTLFVKRLGASLV